MRLPKLTELNAEQLSIFNAPLNETLLVIGPPGSGKTVLAFFRAEALRRKNVDCHVLMYNRVLNSFTKNKDFPDVASDTLLTWLSKWWKKAVGSSIPKIQSAGRRGYRPNDYEEMINRIALASSDANFNWGHIIIDEAQDFPPELYTMFNTCKILKFNSQENAPTITILADENQRITKQNSTIAEIQESSGVSDSNKHSLVKNFRNTKQISEFAGGFYVGLESGRASPPDREGELPRVTRVEQASGVFEKIYRHLRQHEEEEVGVFLQTKSQVRKYFDALKARFASMPNIRVQGYVGGDKELSDKTLQFDRPGTVTIVCLASVKGLEFDTVFIPELHSFRQDESNQEITKMQLYVSCTRARRTLRLLYQGESFQSIGIGRWIPSGDTGLAEWD